MLSSSKSKSKMIHLIHANVTGLHKNCWNAYFIFGCAGLTSLLITVIQLLNLKRHGSLATGPTQLDDYGVACTRGHGRVVLVGIRV